MLLLKVVFLQSLMAATNMVELFAGVLSALNAAINASKSTKKNQIKRESKPASSTTYSDTTFFLKAIPSTTPCIYASEISMLFVFVVVSRNA